MSDQRGFTLTELMISAAIVAMVMAGIFTLQRQGQFAYLFGSARVEVQQNARIALDVMTKELRSAQSLTSIDAAKCNQAYSTSTFNAAAQTIGFNDSSGNAISYALSGASAPYVLQRTDPTNGTTDLVGGVDALDIWCYDASEVLTGTLANVRTVRIRIRTRNEEGASAGSMQAQYAIVESEVRLRNL